MRASCRLVVRYIDKKGRYLLVIDKDQYEQTEEIVLTAPGDYLQAGPEGVSYLQQELHAYEFEDAPALRFHVPDWNSDLVTAWFMGRTNRETNAGRVIHQLLWEDPFHGRPLRHASPLTTISRPLIGMSKEYGYTTRAHVADKRTLWLIDTYNMHLHSKAIESAVTQRAAQRPTTFYFATPQEIRDGITLSNIPINTKLAARLITQDRTIGDK